MDGLDSISLDSSAASLVGSPDDPFRTIPASWDQAAADAGLGADADSNSQSWGDVRGVTGWSGGPFSGLYTNSQAGVATQAIDQVDRTQAATSSNIIPIASADDRQGLKAFRSVVKELGLNKSQQQLLHQEITKQGYDYHEIMAIALDMFGGN